MGSIEKAYLFFKARIQMLEIVIIHFIYITKDFILFGQNVRNLQN